MKILFNYAHNGFYRSQEYNSLTGKQIGGFDKVFQFRLKDIDDEFYIQNRHILDQPRGAGYWLWKYYFADMLVNDSTISENDYIFYSDSGCYFVSSVQNLIDIMERDNISIMTFR